MFLKPIADEFAWSRESVSAVFGVSPLVGAICAAPGGYLRARTRVRIRRSFRGDIMSIRTRTLLMKAHATYLGLASVLAIGAVTTALHLGVGAAQLIAAATALGGARAVSRA